MVMVYNTCYVRRSWRRHWMRGAFRGTFSPRNRSIFPTGRKWKSEGLELWAYMNSLYTLNAKDKFGGQSLLSVGFGQVRIQG